MTPDIIQRIVDVLNLGIILAIITSVILLKIRDKDDQ